MNTRRITAADISDQYKGPMRDVMKDVYKPKQDGVVKPQSDQPPAQKKPKEGRWREEAKS
jgi:hypothetical protein